MSSDLTNDTFTGINGDDFIADGKVAVTNLPSSLTAVIYRRSSTQLHILLTGTADSHASVNNVNSLTFTFADSAFSRGAASTVANYNLSDRIITFTDPAALPTVTVSAIDASAAEPSADDGAFRITRTGATTLSLTVVYAITGTAANGTDYTLIATDVTLSPGNSTTDISVEIGRAHV